MKEMALTTPAKNAKKLDIIDDARRSESPESDDEQPVASSSRERRWVGEVDLPERELFHRVITRRDAC